MIGFNPKWRTVAACKGKDPSIFFPTDSIPSSAKEAFALCDACPVRTECCIDRISTTAPSEDSGIYAKMWGKERARFAKSLGFGRVSRGTTLTDEEIFRKTAIRVGEGHRLK